jgi:hypothetical protein
MISNIEKWVKSGGVLLTLADATAFVASKDRGLLVFERELALKEEEESGEAKSSDDDLVAAKQIKAKKDYFKAIENHKESPDSALAKIDIDTEHWLAAGVNPIVYGLVTGNAIFQSIRLADGTNIGSYSNQDTLLASGYLWDENFVQMPFKPFWCNSIR